MCLFFVKANHLQITQSASLFQSLLERTLWQGEMEILLNCSFRHVLDGRLGFILFSLCLNRLSMPNMEDLKRRIVRIVANCNRPKVTKCSSGWSQGNCYFGSAPPLMKWQLVCIFLILMMRVTIVFWNRSGFLNSVTFVLVSYTIKLSCRKLRFNRTWKISVHNFQGPKSPVC